MNLKNPISLISYKFNSNFKFLLQYTVNFMLIDYFCHHSLCHIIDIIMGT